MGLIETHSLNNVDALVLRAALDAAAERRERDAMLVLVASDRRLLRAAREEGRLVFNPEMDS